ncbi:hypothetical protein FRC06_004025 [Ceratobasidium sp. 370]|nr:hypothetical protein FRC06_004025 [Ceratobasidium sp. 370]
MYALTRFVFFAISVLGLLGVAIAAPVVAENAVAAATHRGWATYYNPSAGVGACGWSNKDKERVAAIGTHLYQTMMIDKNPNHCKACGKTASVTWKGKTIKVKIVDRCPVCGDNDLDLSPTAFKDLAALSVGKLNGVTWTLN